MKIARVALDRSMRLPVGNIDQKEMDIVDAASAQVEIGVRGDWVVLSDARGRQVLLPGSRCRYLVPENVEDDGAAEGSAPATPQQASAAKGRR